MMTTGHSSQADQKSVVLRLLNDEQVLVHLAPQATGVSLPAHLMNNRSVTLRLSRYFKGPIHTDDEKITAELLFGREYFACMIPWTSIWGASSVRGEEYIWSEAAPAEIMDLVLVQQAKMAATSSEQNASHQSRGRQAAKRDVPYLKRVK